MNIEVNLGSFEDSLLGISTCQGEDEDGMFNALLIGFLVFTIGFYWY